jgi:HIV type I enhancer-binding protein
MLKKHIRTHSNFRPYTCRHCNFSFKTKGNLTKHMKSKTHHKKCVELGISPVPTSADDSQGAEGEDKQVNIKNMYQSM